MLTVAAIAENSSRCRHFCRDDIQVIEMEVAKAVLAETLDRKKATVRCVLLEFL